MTMYATVTTAVLLTAVVLNNVCHPGWAASKGEPPTRFRRDSAGVANVYGGDTPSSGLDESDSDDGQDHEDQLDEDDPGNFFYFNLIPFDNMHVPGTVDYIRVVFV